MSQNFITKYDDRTKTLKTPTAEYDIYLSEGYVPDILKEVLRWGEGEKTLQELYADLVVHENNLLKK